MSDALELAFADVSAHVILGPRTAVKNKNISIPLPLPPDIQHSDITVTRAESLRRDIPIPLEDNGKVINYRAVLEGT